MANKCDICGRGPRITSKRSHSHMANKHWQHINLQTKKINGKKIKICSKCLKDLKRKLAKKNNV